MYGRYICSSTSVAARMRTEAWTSSVVLLLVALFVVSRNEEEEETNEENEGTKDSRGTRDTVLEAFRRFQAHSNATLNVDPFEFELVGTKRSKRDVLRALVVLWALETDDEEGMGENENEEEISSEERERMLRYMRYASAAYGYLLLNSNFYEPYASATWQRLSSIFRGSDPNLDALCRHTDIKHDEVVNVEWASGRYSPGHYVAVTPSEIIVSIRGTFSVADVITDLEADACEFYDMPRGAHSGMLRAARRKFRILDETISRLADENEKHDIVVVGHSLGAGVASLLSIELVRAHPHLASRVNCYAFACPPVLSDAVARSADVSRYIRTVVLDSDIVPRLCLRSMRRFRFELQWAHDLARAQRISVRDALSSFAAVLFESSVANATHDLFRFWTQSDDMVGSLLLMDADEEEGTPGVLASIEKRDGTESSCRETLRQRLGLPESKRGFQQRRRRSTYVSKRVRFATEESEHRDCHSKDDEDAWYSSHEAAIRDAEHLRVPGRVFVLRSSSVTWKRRRSSSCSLRRGDVVDAMIGTRAMSSCLNDVSDTRSMRMIRNPSVSVRETSFETLSRLVFSWHSLYVHPPWQYDRAIEECVDVNFDSPRLLPLMKRAAMMERQKERLDASRHRMSMLWWTAALLVGTRVLFYSPHARHNEW